MAQGISVLPGEPGEKVPGQYSASREGWYPMKYAHFQERRPTEAELLKWSTYPDVSTIALLGEYAGVVAVDFDNRPDLHPAVASLLPDTPVKKRGAKGLTWFYRHAGEGNKGWKVNGEMVVEILSNHICHLPPSIHHTGLVYEWVGPSLGDFPKEDLPTLPDDLNVRLDTFFSAFELKLPPRPPAERPALPRDYRQPDDLERVEEALSYISDDSYETWVHMGMAIRTKFPGSDGFAVWDRWSQQSPKYQKNGRGEMDQKWRSFRESPNSSIGLGTLFFLAKQGGYERSSRPSRPSTGQEFTIIEPDPEPEGALNDGKDDILPAPSKPAAPQAPNGYSLKYPIISARHFIRRHEGRVLCRQHQFFVYRERNFHWEIIDDDLFEAFVLRDIDVDFHDLCRSMKMGQLRDIAKAVKRELQSKGDGTLKPDTWLDGREGEFVTCRNGIIDLKTREILPHDPAWFSFTALPFDYEPDARCPAFDAFLHSVWEDDEEIKRSLQMWMGYVITSGMSAQKFGVFIGESRAGKSTLARVLEALVGRDNTVACSLMQFGGDFGLEPVLGKRLAIFNDAQKVQGIQGDVATERIISIVGNDPQPINRKRQAILTVNLPTKILLVCNEIPSFVNRRDALTNRMLVFPFRKSFKGKEDQGLLDRLMDELPGILNWALEGARAVMAGEKLLHAKAGMEAVEEIAEVLDSVKGFIREVVVFTTDTAVKSSFVSNTVLYEAYVRWCKSEGSMAQRKMRFLREFCSKTDGRVVKDKTSDKSRTRGFYGLRLEEDSVFDQGGEASGPPDDGEEEDTQDEIPF